MSTAVFVVCTMFLDPVSLEDEINYFRCKMEGWISVFVISLIIKEVDWPFSLICCPSKCSSDQIKQRKEWRLQCNLYSSDLIDRAAVGVNPPPWKLYPATYQYGFRRIKYQILKRKTWITSQRIQAEAGPCMRSIILYWRQFLEYLV